MRSLAWTFAVLGAAVGAAFLLALSGVRSAPGDRASLALLGDVMLGRGVSQAHSQGEWEEAFQMIAPELSSAGLALANLESPISARALQKDTYDLRAGPQSLTALTSAGIDLVSLANNHSLDCGAAGLEDTRTALRESGLQGIGPGPEPVFRKVKDLRLAFLAFDDLSATLDMEAAARAVREAGERSDLVVVSIHWGREYLPAPTPRQEEIARALAAAGAALIWGHHPHVLQPVEWLAVEGRRRPTLVVYSLGNALFDQGAPPDTLLGALLLVELDPDGVVGVQVTPFQIDRQKGVVQAPGVREARRITDRLQLDRYPNP